MSDKEVNTQKAEALSFPIRVIVGIFLTSLLLIPSFSKAQTPKSTNVAKTISVSDSGISYGDVVLYEPGTNLYRLSNGVDDPRFYGIIVEDPALILEMEDGSVPVIESGVVPMNVTLEGGEISPGDTLITSSTPGKGMKADSKRFNIFGFALEPLTEEDAVTRGENGTKMGTILVEVGGERLRAYVAQQLSESQEAEEAAEEAEKGVDTKAIMKFGFAASVALGAIFLIFFAFLSSIRQGVISVGRNPRAQSAIRSMIVLNVILSIIITAAAIFFAIALLVISD